MVAYKRDEIVSASDMARSFSNILNSIIDKSKEKIAISKNNKLEAVVLDINEYEKLQAAYDLLEQKEIEELLKNRTEEDREVSHTKVLSIDIKEEKIKNTKSANHQALNTILTTLKSLKPKLKKDFGIEEFAIFGSYARGEANENSDIDIAVTKMQIKSGFDLIRAKDFLKEKLNKEVDIGTFKSMKTFIKNRIQKDFIYV